MGIAKNVIGTRLRKKEKLKENDLCNYEPLIRLLPPSIAERPLRIALLFAVAAFSTSCFAAAAEQRLFTAEKGVLPLWSNFSTLLDFLLLDPLIIFYTLRSYLAMSKLGDFKMKPSSRYLTLTLALISIGGMTIYASKFLDGSFKDACVIGKGFGSVTITGWFLFAWTTVFLYIVLGGVVSQIRYVDYVLRISRRGIKYQPFNSDNSAGIRYLAQPAMEFLRVMIALLALFAIFYLYDHVVFEIKASVRLEALIIYLAITPPLFLTPILTLHFAMLQSRNRLLDTLNHRMAGVIDQLADLDAPHGASEMEALQKLHQQLRSLPVWPLPIKQLIESSSYMIGPAIAYAPKIAALLRLGRT